MEKRVKQGSIRSKFVRSILVLLLLTFLLTLAVLLSFVRAYFYTNFYNNMKNGIKTSVDYYENSIAPTGTLVETLYKDRDSWWRTRSARVQIYDANQALLLDSQGSLKRESPSLMDVEHALLGRTEYQIFKAESTGEHMMSVSVPLISAGSVVGVLRHMASLEQVDQNLGNITRLFFFIGFIITAAAALLGLWLSNWMVRPIRELTETARQMAVGRYNVKSPVRNNDEIGTLARTFNHMASEIAKKEELKNEFISSVSHELRTPLTAIKGWAITLKDPQTDPELLAMGLDIIENESDRLKAMVEELLDFSKFSAGRVDLVWSSVDPKDLGRFVVSFAEGRKEREAKDFTFSMDESMEPFQGDENRLKQVLINLIDNSFKFTEPGGAVFVDFFQDAQKTSLVVSDTGIGIGPDEIGKVREKFYKGKHSKSSSGIGLSIVSEIAHLHGGELYIESELGQGTSMEVVLPREGHHAKKI